MSGHSTHVILVQAAIDPIQLFPSVFCLAFQLSTSILPVIQLRVVTLTSGLKVPLVRFGLRTDGIEFPLHRPQLVGVIRGPLPQVSD